MSEENVEIVRRLIDAANGDDLAETLRLYSPEVEIDWVALEGAATGRVSGAARGSRPSGWSSGCYFRGRSALMPSDFIASGSEVVVPNTAHFRGRDGIEVVARATIVYTVENGQVTRFRMFQERDEALEAAGLRE